jgi:hypothetical protein
MLDTLARRRHTAYFALLRSKASDLLVRYNNGLLSEADVVEAIVTLLMRNTAALKNPILR